MDFCSFLTTAFAAASASAATLSYRAAAPSTAAATSEPAKMTVVKIVSEAESDFPTNKARHVFGPLERFSISICPVIPLIWTTEGIDSADFGNQYIAPNHASTFYITAFEHNETLILPYRTINPSYVSDWNDFKVPTNEWVDHDAVMPLEGHVGVGLITRPKLCPSYVCFEHLLVCETEVDATNVWGYFADTNRLPVASLRHDRAAGAERQISISSGNVAGEDLASLTLTNPPPWTAGGFSWPIQAYWFTEDNQTTNALYWSTQIFQVYANGDATVRKFGHTVSRGTNDVSETWLAD